MTGHDPFDLLRRLAPDTPLPDDAVDDGLLARILATLDARAAGTRRTRRIRRAAAGLIAIGAISGTTVAVAVRRDAAPPPRTPFVTCWNTAPPTIQWELVVEVGIDPVVACSAPWSNGSFGTDEPPALVACLSGTGVTAVIPGRTPEACLDAGLGATRAGPLRTDEVDEVTALQLDLASRLALTCATEDEVLAAIDTARDTHDLADWTVRNDATFTADRPCGHVAVDPATRTIAVRAMRDTDRPP